MIYRFNNFNLDTDKQELSFDGLTIPLTKQLFDLLLLFVGNPNKVFSKDDIISQVWQGKYVTENSIDKSVSKLRKILGAQEKQNILKQNALKQDYIKTAYGKGFMFVSEVVIQNIQKTSNVKHQTTKNYGVKLSLIIIALLVINFGFLYFNNKQSSDAVPGPLLLILSSAEASEGDSWLNQSSVAYIDQIFGLTDAANLKNFTEKPKHQDRQQYINNQWKISPDLKVVTTKVIQHGDLYTVELHIVDRLQQKQTHKFTRQNLGLAMRNASKWLANTVNSNTSLENIDSLIPQDSYVVELYMHGLASYGKGEITKAENYFQLCLQEKPDFYLAKLELARVKSALGKQQQGLALLTTLLESVNTPQMDIEIQSIFGAIYNIQGKDEQNKKLYLSVLQKYAGKDYTQLQKIKYNLSFTYTKLTDFNAALKLLDELESTVDESIDPAFLAHTAQKKASILQKQGHIKQAQVSAEKSLRLFSKLGDLLGEAKIHTTLARISTHQSKYKASINHLEQSLAICKTLDYKLGIGATLNELIYVLMVQGYFTKALAFNQEMESIAIEIDYNAMLQISKQFSMDITRSQNQWVKSSIYLQEHLQLAQASNNKSALLTNKLLEIDLSLDQDKVENVEELILEVQTHIDQKGEIRLQPRINKQLARLYLLMDKKELAIELLLSTKELSKETEDGEIIIEINNILAELYIDSDQPQKALAVLNDSFAYHPSAYPYLLLKSKINLALGNRIQALDLANECKVSANEWWSLEDDRYLSGILSEIKHQE